MRRFAKALLIIHFCLFAASGAFAQLRTRLVSTLPTARCVTGELESKTYRVSDGISVSDCAVGGGGFSVDCVCDSGAWRAINAFDSALYVLLSGDADGQVVQGISGANAARVDLGVFDNQGVRLIGGGATPAYAYADNGSAGLGSFDGVSDISVTDAAINMTSEGNVSMGSGDDNWLDLTPTYFEVGVGSTSLNVGEAQIDFTASTDGTDENSGYLTLSSHGLAFDAADGAAQLSLEAAEGFHFSGTRFRLTTPAPSTSTDTCYPGMFAWDTSYIYVCVDTDTWKRSTLASF